MATRERGVDGADAGGDNAVAGPQRWRQRVLGLPKSTATAQRLGPRSPARAPRSTAAGLRRSLRFEGRPDAKAVRVSVVIPTFNEERNLVHVLPRLPRWIDEVLIVDGRSVDGTIGEALRLRPDARIVMRAPAGERACVVCRYSRQQW